MSTANLAGVAERTYRPALDGLRAVAVGGVILYHLGYGWLPGGFLGVDLFFVLSGYLITGLLLDEYDRRGRIGLPAFYARRVRRLMPALLLVLFAVVAALRVLAPRGRGPAAAAISWPPSSTTPTGTSSGPTSPTSRLPSCWTA